VAVKLMAGVGSAARFRREARAAARLRHPGVVAIYDAGTEQDGTAFIVMELLRGRSLAEVIAAEAPLEPPRARSIAREIAEALAAAHAAGVVHRDIKPANVIIAAGGAVRVLDFGIARLLDATAITQTAEVVGTASYMAPEHLSGEPADARSDVYSLGCVLYAMLTAHPPFVGDSTAAVIAQHLSAPPHPPGVDADLDALVLAMLAKDPAARPQSAAEVARRLEGAPPQATRLMEPVATVGRRGGIAAAEVGRRRGLGSALALAAALAALALVLLALGSGAPAHVPPPAHHATAGATGATAPAAQSSNPPPTTLNTPAQQTNLPPGQERKLDGHAHGRGHGGFGHFGDGGPGGDGGDGGGD
jgi:serine/threonine-protein kinase